MYKFGRVDHRAASVGRTLHRPWLQLGSLIVAAALAFALPAQAAKELIRGNAGEPKSLDPHRATGTWENNIIGDMVLGLYTEAADASPILGAADDAKTSPDGLRWTFHIRPHTWSDGKPVTSNDFVFAMRRILDPKFAAEYCEILFPIKNAEKINKGKLPVDTLGVSAPTPDTLIIDLENPAPYLPQLLTHYTSFPLPQHVVEKYKNDWIKPGNIVSNGPYMLESWRPHDHITLVKNPKFYDAANVKIDRVTFLPIEDDLSALKRYRAGEIDMQERWPLTEQKWLKQNIPNEARSFTYLSVTYTTFNMTKKPFNDARVRRAVAETIDRDLIGRDIFFNAYGKEAFSFLPPGLAGVDYSAQVPYAKTPMAERIANAKQLLTEAGYGPNNPLKFTYNFINFPDAKRSAIAIQSMMRQIGVTMELVAGEPKVHYDALKTKNYEAANAAWVFDYSDAKNILYLFQSTTVQQNYPGYNNPEYDSLMQRADAEPDGVKRGQLLGQANGLLMRDLPAAPVFHQFERTLVKPYVLNFVENPRVVFRTRWMDIGDKKAPGSVASGGNGGARASEGGFWDWFGSWFSPDAWQKWWNS
ncbi:MAG: peptide ABC transporter substrate-binding protein [Alphaproteobacteria bacterium]|nr:peptide ABC transporter substrate-binding protein [Alphaproteobacteria bacterium]